MDTIIRQLRFAARSLLRDKGFAATTILTLAISIGASAAMFAIVNSVLLRPLPFPDSDAIVLRLTVRDDGRGITPKEQADPRSIGLLGMRERAALLGGETEIAPAPGGGTIVTVTAPLRALSGEEKP